MNLLPTLLIQLAQDFQNLSPEDEDKLIRFVINLLHPDQIMSKVLCCEYLGISRSTFDNLIKNGYIPKGEKIEGFTELVWHKYQLDQYLNNRV